MRTSVKGILVAAMIMAAGSFCFGEQIDNPQYKNWAKFKPGTSVTHKIEMDMNGTKIESERTQTLVSVDADKAVVEMKSSMTMAGKQTDMPAMNIDIKAKIDKPATPADAPKADVAAKETTEEVDAAGTKVKATVTEATVSMNGMKTVSKTWSSEEVPGGVIKMESTTEGAMKGTSKTTLTAMTIK